MRMRVCCLDCYEAGLCCYLVIHIVNLLRPLQLFYFHLWSIYWLSLAAASIVVNTVLMITCYVCRFGLYMQRAKQCNKPSSHRNTRCKLKHCADNCVFLIKTRVLGNGSVLFREAWKAHEHILRAEFSVFSVMQ
jgi:hypothetical protein